MARQLKHDIRREGHPITGGADALLSAPRVEMTDGKLFNCEQDRLYMLALLLESVGIDAAVKIGPSRLWRQAVATLSD